MVEYVWEEEFCGIPSDIVTDIQRDVLYLKYVSLMGVEDISAEVNLPASCVSREYQLALGCVEEFLVNRAFLLRCQKMWRNCDGVRGGVV